ncbi:MAG TPA: organic hydroperoxide resistance protein [Geminicoccaceae bacterium]|nr:organic hydroperoxide resistance protein [Geminicoccus sp.]HMU50066.1 organic hydroperoxide resistance protein [Geminicoccaceae bacterium]
MKVEKVLYKTSATATGGGRDGSVHTDDNTLEFQLAVPKEMGGPGGPAANPEKLFACGYAACFLGAMRFVAKNEKITVPPDATVTAEVGFGQLPHGFGLDIGLIIKIPGMDKATAQGLVEKAHQVCPYSNATRNNVDVRLTVA